MLKSEIRSLYKEKRSGLSPNELERISSQVIALVRDSFSFKDKYVNLFLPIERQKEIDTYELLEDIIQQGGQPVVAKSDFSDISMSLFLYESANQLKLNDFGIPEPTSGIEIQAEQLDIVFVPLLGLDAKGFRVGYGKGFYDRLLKRCKPECLFIGLHLFDEFKNVDDLHPNDIALHMCFTPTKKYDFR
jgi:5-formyltetrahydrofolate cyclo-ligase